MWLVVGLGNPGDAYEDTRHNIGFMVVDALAIRESVSLNQKAKHYTYGRGLIGNQEAILIKPLTYMNKSGVAVRDAIKRFDEADNILVVHDDIDLDTGVIRIRKTGSSGGHRGIESIIGSLGSKDFIRLKIGIGRSDRIPAERYVLSTFKKKERQVVKEAVEKAADAIPIILDKGISCAQNRFHRE